MLHSLIKVMTKGMKIMYFDSTLAKFGWTPGSWLMDAHHSGKNTVTRK
jgi:hypothetical protein